MEAPIPILMPLDGLLVNHSKTIEFSIVFNYSGCAKLFIGFVPRRIYILDAVSELAKYFEWRTAAS